MIMKAQNDVRVTFRVNKELKERADVLFDRLGMNMRPHSTYFCEKRLTSLPFHLPSALMKPALDLGFQQAKLQTPLQPL